MGLDLKRERDKAMRHAYAAAREGKVVLADSWRRRAVSFWPITTRQQLYLDLTLINDMAARANREERL